jgi:hypothetical protein
MSRRFQFSLRALLGVATLAAIAGAASRPLVRISESYDLLGLLFVLIGSTLAPAALVLAILIFFPSPHRKRQRSEYDD